MRELTDSGLDFQHDSGGFGRKYFAEINQGGVSLFDADGDGRLDAFFPQGGAMPGDPGPERLFHDALFLGRPGLHFVPAPADCGLSDDEPTFAGAVADVDRDGDLDLLTVNLGRNHLFLNDGRAVFTVAPGLPEEEWSAAACFADLDTDGDVDLYVGNYVEYAFDDPECGTELGPRHRSYCHPALFTGRADRLYRNDGPGPDGPLLRDLGAPGEFDQPPGKALALVSFDVDRDGDLDLFVANDSVPNFLWINEGALSFAERAGTWGLATNTEGRAEACMGSDLADVDGDLDLDLVSVNMAEETHTLWLREGSVFEDSTRLSGLAASSRHVVGFGAKFLDYDLDGDADLFVANGHVLDDVARHDPSQSYAQPDHLFVNVGRGKFRPLSVPALDVPRVGRGVAVGDLDDDGDLDLVVGVHGGRPVLLENRTRAPGDSRGPHWIGFDLGPQGLGARVVVHADGERWLQVACAGAGYAAYHDRRLRFGLGARTAVHRVEVTWIGGRRSVLVHPAVDQDHRIAPPD